MAQSIVIAVPAYLLKRGVSAVIQDMVQAEIVYVDGMEELNHYLESNTVEAILIDEAFLGNKDERDLFFQLKHHALCFVLADEPQKVPARQRFHTIIEKNAPKQQLVPLLEKHLSLDTEQSDNRSSILSERETEVLKQVAMGYTNQEIAERLYISRHTVISHRKNITSKLGIKTVSGLTVYAVLNNLIPKDQIQ
jgi:DNA-binding CsgD family transcriptional regulator